MTTTSAMRRSSALELVTLAALALAPLTALAQQETGAPAAGALPAAGDAAPDGGDAAPAVEPAATAQAPEPLGLALDLGVSSVYVFRGWNMFQKSSQWDQHAFLAPSLTYAVGKTGLSIGYWGAYQFLGDNVGAAMDAGFGAENDLVFTFGREVASGVTAGAALTAYLYPAGKKATAGADFPVYLEPAIFVVWSSVLDVGLKLAYYHGLQKGIGAYRYLYVNPTLGKTVALTERVSLSVSGSFGAKLFNDNTTPVAQMNRYDLLVGVAVPIAVVGPLYVKPSVSWAWTDLPDKGFADEMVVFGAVNIGAAL